MLTIPENTTAFLYWLKEQTEAYWRQNPRTEEGPGHWIEWPAGSSWRGMSEEEIDQTERHYGVRFTPDHRAFLRILHTLDPPAINVWEADGYQTTRRTETRLFYNWLTDEAELRQRLAWPYAEILRDIEGVNRYWSRAWGPRPATATEREASFRRFFAHAPRLLPLLGHRFMVSEPLQAGNPVLSVYGTDTIIYGWDLRHYLLSEMGHYLDIHRFNEQEEEWYSVTEPTVESIIGQAWASSRHRRIPFYEDIIQPHAGWPPTP